MTQKVTKAIIAAAGMGTRFLPMTKAMPKEMLPIIDKPVIQIIVEDMVSAGVTDIIIVTGSTKRAIEDHFDRSSEMEAELRAKGKTEEADEIQRIAELANFIYVRQKGEPKGTARPILNAAHLINDEPFFVFFADDFLRSETAHAQQLIDVYERTNKSVISLIEVPKRDASKYGMVAVEEQLDERTVKIGELVEKPGPDETPSNIASVSGFLLTPDILPLVEQSEVSVRGEIELAAAINQLAIQDEVYGCLIEGVRHDAGNKLGYLKAVVDVALTDKKLGPPLEKYLRERLSISDQR